MRNANASRFLMPLTILLFSGYVLFAQDDNKPESVLEQLKKLTTRVHKLEKRAKANDETAKHHSPVAFIYRNLKVLTKSVEKSNIEEKKRSKENKKAIRNLENRVPEIVLNYDMTNKRILHNKGVNTVNQVGTGYQINYKQNLGNSIYTVVANRYGPMTTWGDGGGIGAVSIKQKANQSLQVVAWEWQGANKFFQETRKGTFEILIYKN